MPVSERALECGCRVRGEGLATEVFAPCAEGQAAIDGLRWVGNMLLLKGPEWDRYAQHFACLQRDESR